MGHFLHHWLFEDYWLPTWPNAGAIPLCLLAGAIGTYCFRKPLLRLWDRIKADMHADVHGELRAIRETAEKAHRIAAATYRHQTGVDHPDAPAGRV